MIDWNRVVKKSKELFGEVDRSGNQYSKTIYLPRGRYTVSLNSYTHTLEFDVFEDTTLPLSYKVNEDKIQIAQIGLVLNFDNPEFVEEENKLFFRNKDTELMIWRW